MGAIMPAKFEVVPLGGGDKRNFAGRMARI
jgi:hypothetical protein